MSPEGLKRGCSLPKSGVHRGSFRSRLGPPRPSTKGAASPGIISMRPKALDLARHARQARSEQGAICGPGGQESPGGIRPPSKTPVTPVEAGVPRRDRRADRARAGAKASAAEGERSRGRRKKLLLAADTTPPLQKEPMPIPIAADTTPPLGFEHLQTARGDLPTMRTSRARKHARRGTSTRRGPERHAAQGTVRGEEALKNQADPLAEQDVGRGLRRGPRDDGDPKDDIDRWCEGLNRHTAGVDHTSGEGGGRRSACNAPAYPTLPHNAEAEESRSIYRSAQVRAPRQDRENDRREHEPPRGTTGKTH